MLEDECPECGRKYTLRAVTFNYGNPFECTHIFCTECPYDTAT